MTVYGEFQRAFLGPLGEALDDPATSELMINGPDRVFAERDGAIVALDGAFPGGAGGLEAFARNVAESSSRRLDEENPVLDARLENGARVCIVIPPCTPAIHVNIRPTRVVAADVDRLVERGTLTIEAAEILVQAVRDRRNVVIAGATGAGKSTLLNALAARIDPQERIVVIEDTSELQLGQPHVVPMQARPAGEALPSVTIRDLFTASLRMRPDRILVGEIRRGEALDVLQAMLSGHSGVLTTIHADSPESTLIRLETLCLMADVKIPLPAVRRQLAAIQLVVQLRRLSDGRRVITDIADVSPDCESGYRLQTVYSGNSGKLFSGIP